MIYPEHPSRLLEGNVVDDNTRTVLNQMDPYDEENCNDDTLTQRIKEIVERAAAATEAENATPSEAIASPATKGEPQGEDNASVVLSPTQKVISVTPQVRMGRPAARSTPYPPSVPTSVPKFPAMENIRQESENSNSIKLQFPEPPIDTMGLLMSMLGQHQPLNQFSSSQILKFEGEKYKLLVFIDI